MRRHFQTLACLVALVGVVTGCTTRSTFPSRTQLACEDRITEQFVAKYVRPLSDPVAVLAHESAPIPAELLASNRVTCVEVKPRKGEWRTLFADPSQRPPEGGMTTSVRNAQNIGMYYPATPDQREIEVRMNYFCDVGDFVAVHVVVLNPLLLSFRK
jgi:hypothetical protein